MMTDPTVTMKLSELEDLKRKHAEELQRKMGRIWDLERQRELYKQALSEYQDDLQIKALKAALKYADAEWASSHYCVAVAGLSETRGRFLAAMKQLIGVERGRELEYGHLSFCVSRWEKTHG